MEIQLTKVIFIIKFNVILGIEHPNINQPESLLRLTYSNFQDYTISQYNNGLKISNFC